MIVLDRKTLWRIFLIIIIITTIGFIWSNSLENAEKSSKMSSTVVEKVKPIVDPEDRIDDDLFVTIVRKTAHFSEFAILGAEMYLFISTFEGMKKRKPYSILIPVCATFPISITDECLQLTSEGRSCEFTDMMIDLSGIVVGVTVIALLLYLFKKVSGKAG